MLKSIEVRGAVKSYGNGENKKNILNGLNMSVERGSIYSLIGASGCGKTTLLSCILGIKELENGTVNVLGHKVIYNKPTNVGHLIGYMPQDTALVPELSIREILYYFGNIFQMNEKDLNERYEMIKELLELPSEDRRIENLSGGQKRRVSLAAAIIHNPLILILDEPTVGLDAVLREKIWNFIINTTRTSHLSVIITTHYISEAQQADRCGMMRDGILLAEDTPQNIMTKYGSETLDEAFLNICLLRKNLSNDLETTLKPAEITDENIQEEQELLNEISRVNLTIEAFEKRKKFTKQTIGALCTKEFIRLKRQAAEVFFILILPLIQVLAFAYALGGNPIGLKLGIVNEEVINESDCVDYLKYNASFLNANDECIFNYTSCHFFNEIRDTDAVKVYYKSFDEAYEDARRGRLRGVISISSNFSKYFMNFVEVKEREFSNDYLNIYLDQSDMQITTYLKYRLFKSYQRLTEKLTTGCSMNEKIGTIPMEFNTEFGSLEGNFKQTIFPPLILQLILFPSIGFSCMSIAQMRLDGVWNRTLLAGVRPIEILATQVILCFIVVVIMFFEMIGTAMLTIDIVNKGSSLLLIAIGLVVVFGGSLMGISLSVMIDDVKFISILMLTATEVMSNLCGAFWPLDGQPSLLRYFSFALPLTLPSQSVRNIMLKGHGIDHPSVYKGFIVSGIWMAITIVVSIKAINVRRYANV